jgi:6-phosphogluconolactonase
VIPRVALSAVLAFLILAGASPAAAQPFVYVANEGSHNVRAFSIDPAGALTPTPGSPFATGPYPVSVAVSADGSFVYVANYACAFGAGCGATQSSVSAYTVDSTGDLVPVPGSPFATGIGSVSVSIGPSGHFVYVANFFSSDVSAFAIDSTGALSPVPGSPFATGPGPISVQTTPSGNFVYVANTGNSTISGYAVAANGSLSPVAGSPVAGGNSGGQIAIAGSHLYVADGVANTVMGFTIAANGSLTPMAGSPFPAGNHPYAVNVDPSGQFAFAPNLFGSDVTVYRINASSGALTSLASAAPAGNGAVSVGSLAAAEHAFVANYYANTLSSFSVDATGSITSGPTYPVGSFPVSVAVVAGAPPVVLSICPLYDVTKAVKSGATIPVKVQVCDGEGHNLSAPSLMLHATSVVLASTDISGAVEDSGNANPEQDFRYSETLGGTGGYIFNLSTKGMTTGTYRLNFTIGADATVYSVTFQVQ